MKETRVQKAEEKLQKQIKDTPPVVDAKTQNQKTDFSPFDQSELEESTTFPATNQLQIEAFTPLYTTIDELSYQRNESFSTHPLSNNEINKRFGKRLKAWLVAEGMLYPYTNKSQNLVGWRAGVAFQYPLGKKWSARAGIAYYQRGGQFERSDEKTSITYGFGSQEATQFLAPQQLHYLTIPVELHYIKNRSDFSLGVGYHYLLGVQGQLQETNDPELNPNQTPALIQQGWVAENGFRKNHFDLSLGYTYQVNTRLNLRLRLRYTPGSILDSSYSAPSGAILRESKPVVLGVGFGYRLF